MRRRSFLATLPALAAARALVVAAGGERNRIGICSFSCHQHWRAVGEKYAGVKFTDVLSFHRYGRELGADGVQTPLRVRDEVVAKAMRSRVEEGGGFYEGDLRLPRSEAELAGFEEDVRLAREAGATVARAVFISGRRYEVFRTMEEFRRFHAGARRTLAVVEPVLRKHGLKLAIENHKDHTTEELIALMRGIASEWIGVLVDTGNNLALLEEPHATAEALAPFALSVHLKDMAVQPDADGFLLSEVPLGTGMLDLPRIIATLRRANPALVFNLEMATRDPLRIPCRTAEFFATFPERKATHLDTALERVTSNPPRGPVPRMTGKPLGAQLSEEERNNRYGLAWMHKNFHP